MRWDLFCNVIDNYGDAGVCWRLARDLALAGDTVRLWTDAPDMLRWMAPEGCEGVSAIDWSDAEAVATAATEDAPDVLIEAFGCEPATALVARFAARAKAHARGTAWINLEYLSAEPYVERLHTLPSPVFKGPGEGLSKHFFYPGFTRGTGGLLRELDLVERQAAFDRRGWLAGHGVDWQGERVVTLFCYEPLDLRHLMTHWAGGAEPTRLLVTSGRAALAVQATLQGMDGASQTGIGMLSITFLPFLTQTAFDELLWAADFNFVRGEDSLVRAIWAGKPFAWQIYPQDDDAHHVKLDALLDAIDAPPTLRRFHAAWNGTVDAPIDWPDAAILDDWSAALKPARERLLAQDDLVTQLRRFVARISG
ncbi:elongation factor P maturation arginine rhamnosyltransferase EarP [Variovorax sp. RHLX14]|uniref:elongation factor P maturation arginine rhamnosyltransferase EarP n=1 Tax=Variovorax sp. RHLX14 TaxID=1259731 RepID=UPI003F448C0B